MNCNPENPPIDLVLKPSADAVSPPRIPSSASTPTTRRAIFEHLFSLPAVCTVLVAVWIYFLVPGSMQDPDIWWHLRNAALQWQAHAWLHRDVYSFTAGGAPWINHEWLAEVPFYLAWRFAGSSGIHALTLLTIEFTLLGVYAITRIQSHGCTPTASVLATAVAAVLATVSFGPRMLLFGWACLVMELFILEKFLAAPQTHKGRLLFLPLLFAIWINLHGSWLIGLILFAVFFFCGSVSFKIGSISNRAWTGSQRRLLAIVLVLSLGAIFINPYGWRLVLYPFDMAFHQTLNIATVEEWKPLNPQTARGFMFLLALGALSLAQLCKRRSWSLWELALAAIGSYAALRHSRFLFLGAILVMPLLGKHLAVMLSGHAKIGAPNSQPAQTVRRPVLNAALIASTLLIPALAMARSRATHSVPEQLFPVAALPWLEHFQPQGRLFNEYLWGGYLAYNTPQIPVFIDSRMDIYERNGTLRDYLDIIHLQHPLELLECYRVRYVLFEKETPLVYLLQQTHAWKPDYDDGKVILLERSSTPVAWSSRATPISASTQQ